MLSEQYAAFKYNQILQYAFRRLLANIQAIPPGIYPKTKAARIPGPTRLLNRNGDQPYAIAALAPKRCSWMRSYSFT